MSVVQELSQERSEYGEEDGDGERERLQPQEAILEDEAEEEEATMHEQEEKEAVIEEEREEEEPQEQAEE